MECYGLFEQLFIFKKNENELANNLASPDRDNPFGKTPDQRKNFMNWQDYLINEAHEFSPVIIKGNDIKIAYQTIAEDVAKSAH